MNEAETRAELIDPALAQAGWGRVEASRVRREVIAPGRLIGSNKRGKAEIADYVLIYKGHKLAVIEAKRRSLPDTEGVAQAKSYATRLQTRFAFSTNGLGIYQINMETGQEEHVAAFPSPEQLWDATFKEADSWRDRFAAIPFEDRGGGWQARYYQHNAINRVLEAIAAGQDRILLTLATGTGKTCIAFQLAWKLFHSRWNLRDRKTTNQPTRRPRILFLADRNILANQAFNAFSAFAEDALVRIDPASIRKKGTVPRNGSIFFTIFQTFMSGRDQEGNPLPSFGEYPPDFFDCIVIDECHRGGANDESSWREILEYFAPAVQLGLTATPKRAKNRDTYAYFGEPVYTYSLREGINDGFLTPFRVRQIATTLDDYVYTPDDEVLTGEIEQGRRYTEANFNRSIEIGVREKYRVGLFMKMIGAQEKTLVFCATQEHALVVRDLINQQSSSPNPNYCVRVTADDGARGEGLLRTFQDNEKTIPTILTTSQKLSTGVDASNIRNIVLMRPVNSMIEFKQIIGRGTRLFEGKEYFTIYDFVRAYHHFSDPEWDGEPEAVLIEQPDTSPESGPDSGPDLGSDSGSGIAEPSPEYDPSDSTDKPKILRLKLADGKERLLQSMSATTFWSPGGTPISAAQFIEELYGELPALFRDEDELRRLWSKPETRKKLLTGLEEKGFGTDQLNQIKQHIQAENSDLFDVLAYIAFALPVISRKERAENSGPAIFRSCSEQENDFLRFILDHYIAQGVSELDQEKLPGLLELKYHSLGDAVDTLGSIAEIRQLFVGFQGSLYTNL
ncbi:MAG: DEAD/DEAH box helicase family protein [Candidatus Electrothrix sp. Rat3]|nr:DEAD/DEAH box helicase family protein [Candidatus Electrothrix rattekaaiensis]